MDFSVFWHDAQGQLDRTFDNIVTTIFGGDNDQISLLYEMFGLSLFSGISTVQ